MPQLDLSAIVTKIRSLEAALPGFCDKAIAKLQAQEGGTVGDFILHHLGVADPKACEDELISALKMVKSIVTEEQAFVDPFLDLLLSLKPAPKAA